MRNTEHPVVIIASKLAKNQAQFNVMLEVIGKHGIAHAWYPRQRVFRVETPISRVARHKAPLGADRSTKIALSAVSGYLRGILTEPEPVVSAPLPTCATSACACSVIAIEQWKAGSRYRISQGVLEPFYRPTNVRLILHADGRRQYVQSTPIRIVRS